MPQDAADNSFSDSVALETALAATPDIRPDAVARARQLIQDTGYPSSDTIRQLAGFLAQKISTADLQS